jgi:hypothetical protein
MVEGQSHIDLNNYNDILSRDGGGPNSHEAQQSYSHPIGAMILPFEMSKRFPWKTDTLKSLSIEEGCIPTTRVPGGYNVAIGTSQQKMATATSTGVLKYNW